MITNANVIAYFAESIRAEVSGQHTLVGVFDDIAEFPSLPATIPQLAVHTTISTLTNDPFVPKLFRVFLSTGETVASHSLPDDFESHQAEVITKRKVDGGSIWIHLRVIVALGGITVSEGAKLFVEFEDNSGRLARSNDLSFQSKLQSTTLVAGEGDETSKI